MGEPRRQRKKYTRPKHLWRTVRIEAENQLIEKYGLKNKREIWRAQASIARARHQAIKLQALRGEEADKEKNELIQRLNKIGLLKSNTLEAVLALTVEDLLERRLQTVVYRKGICQTPRQARQMITHGHIVVGDNVVTVPRYTVKVSEEESIRLKEGVSPPIVHKKEPKADSPTGKVKAAEEPKMHVPSDVPVGQKPEEKTTEGVSVGQEA